MGIEVGTSLWQATGKHMPAHVRDESTPDFGARLGLASESPVARQREATMDRPESARPEVALPDAVMSDASARLREAGKNALNPSAVAGNAPSAAWLELYALGLQAGLHLSYVPRVFHGSDVHHAALVSGQQTVARADAVPGAAHAAPDGVDVSAAHDSAVVRAAAYTASAALSDLDLPEAIRNGIGHFSAKWSERRWQLLAQPEGLSLLVRDYHLSVDDQEALVADLITSLSSMPDAPEKLWVNGQLVWQAETTRRAGMTGGRHGR